MVREKGRDKRFNGDNSDAREDNDGAHSTPAPTKRISGVGGIAQYKQFTMDETVVCVLVNSLQTSAARSFSGLFLIPLARRGWCNWRHRIVRWIFKISWLNGAKESLGAKNNNSGCVIGCPWYFSSAGVTPRIRIAIYERSYRYTHGSPIGKVTAELALAKAASYSSIASHCAGRAPTLHAGAQEQKPKPVQQMVRGGSPNSESQSS